MNPNWEICQWIDYCSGPEEEGISQDAPYATRWGAVLNRDDGIITYGIVGQGTQEAPAALFPSALDGAVSVSLSFDQAADPVFAVGFNDGRIEVRREVLGVPTTYTFTGVTPRLLFNGILLEVHSLDSDVVCYYVKDGTIKSRYQRDNFGVEYTASNFPFEVLSIKKTDTKEYREIIYLKRSVSSFFSENWAMRSPIYPLPPISASDEGTLESIIQSGRYLDIIVDGGSYADESELASEIWAGRYLDIIVSTSAADSATLDSGITEGEYVLVIINGGSYSDSSALSSAINSGAYTLVVISGGSYAESATLSSAITGGSYYT